MIFIPGSALASRAADGALAIATFFLRTRSKSRRKSFGEGAETGTRGACAPQYSQSLWVSSLKQFSPMMMLPPAENGN